MTAMPTAASAVALPSWRVAAPSRTTPPAVTAALTGVTRRSTASTAASASTAPKNSCAPGV
ncbi:hypothetical protein [Nonomuraea salmonea]|uniref:hypothetical protein n=1 Tax=Nonomuraea salmonea TaxID=46181 RepID=UPI0031ED720B